jgi:hypothetical protein
MNTGKETKSGSGSSNDVASSTCVFLHHKLHPTMATDTNGNWERLF